MVFRSFFPLCTALIFSLLCTKAGAQVGGPVRQIPNTVPTHKEKSPSATIPICNGDYAYNIEKTKGGRFGYVYSVSEGKVIASSEIVFDYPEKESFSFLTNFMAGESPAILYRVWEKKTGKVNLFTQLYDPETFKPSGPPRAIGVIPFDPKSYAGYGPKMIVKSSPDGSKLLFYFDKIKAQEVQLVMCWVTDASLDPLWNGIYRVPAQSTGFDRELFFTDEGAVYLEVRAVMLTEDNVKEKADGSVKVKVDHRYWKNKSTSYFKLFGEEYRMWDGVLSEEFDTYGGSFAVRGDKVYYGALIGPKDGEQPQEWVIAEMSKDLVPVNGERMLVEKVEKDGLGLNSLVMNDVGGGYFLARRDGSTVVCAFEEDGKVRWVNSIKWENWSLDDISPISKNDRLHLFTMTYRSQQEKPKEGALNQSGADGKIPVMVTFDEHGKLFIEDLVTAKNGGERYMDVLVPKFEQVARCGYFIDRTYAKNQRGLVMVPLK